MPAVLKLLDFNISFMAMEEHEEFAKEVAGDL